MTQESLPSEAISLLQELGLQEYEARCFTALAHLPKGTAKDIHELSGVPRTRVYDAIQELESKGLVEVQHSNPQQFRSVEINEAAQTLRQQYNSRIDDLHTSLADAEPQSIGREDDQLQEVWSLSGHEAIESRTLDLIDKAESEIALIVVDETVMSETLFEKLHEAADRELSILLGGQTEAITSQIDSELPNIRVFQTELDWLTGAPSDHEVAISRIILIDREMLLIGSYYPDADDETATEQAIFAKGLENGIVVLLHRLVSSGLTSVNDPET
jgi:sugar-specific transcriptional regulator TrmB